MDDGKEIKKGGNALSAIAFILALLSLLAAGGGTYWFAKELKKVHSAINDVKNVADESKTATQKLDASINKMGSDISGLGNQLAEQKALAAKLPPRLDSMDNTISGFKSQVDGIKNDLMGNLAEDKKLEEAVNDGQTKLTEVKDQVKEVVGRYDAINDTVAKLTERIAAAESKMEELSNELGSVKQAASEEKETADTYFGKAEKFYSEREWDKAIRFYDKAISMKPDWAVAYENRGMAKFQSEDYQGALEDFDKTRKLDPTRAETVDKYMDDAKAKLKKQKK